MGVISGLCNTNWRHDAVLFSLQLCAAHKALPLILNQENEPQKYSCWNETKAHHWLFCSLGHLEHHILLFILRALCVAHANFWGFWKPPSLPHTHRRSGSAQASDLMPCLKSRFSQKSSYTYMASIYSTEQLLILPNRQKVCFSSSAVIERTNIGHVHSPPPCPSSPEPSVMFWLQDILRHKVGILFLHAPGHSCERAVFPHNAVH